MKGGSPLFPRLFSLPSGFVDAAKADEVETFYGTLTLVNGYEACQKARDQCVESIRSNARWKKSAIKSIRQWINKNSNKSHTLWIYLIDCLTSLLHALSYRQALRSINLKKQDVRKNLRTLHISSRPQLHCRKTVLNVTHLVTTLLVDQTKPHKLYTEHTSCSLQLSIIPISQYDSYHECHHQRIWIQGIIFDIGCPIQLSTIYQTQTLCQIRSQTCTAATATFRKYATSSWLTNWQRLHRSYCTLHGCGRDDKEEWLSKFIHVYIMCYNCSDFLVEIWIWKATTTEALLFMWYFWEWSQGKWLIHGMQMETDGEHGLTAQTICVILNGRMYICGRRHCKLWRMRIDGIPVMLCDW